MILKSFFCFCMNIGFWINIAHPSAILFGDYPYPEHD